MARRPRSKKKLIAVPEAASPKKPIFGPGTSDAIPGELIVQLEEAAAALVTTSIPRGPTRGRGLAGPSTFGVSALDQALSALKVTAITRLHPPPPVVSEALEHVASMASTFRISYTSGVAVDEAVKKLGAIEGVQFAEPNRYRETCVVPNDASFAAQWGLAKLNCPAAWDKTTGSPNVVVAVIDTGIDLDHPELATLLVPGTDMVDLGASPVAPPGFRFEGDFQGRDNVPQDEVGHGTHVAGTIACLSNNTTGVAGVTWNCRLMAVRVLARIVNVADPTDVRGVGSAADISAGIRWAVDNGARVLNLSLGGPTDTQVERDAIAYAVAQGAVVVAAMGNAFQNGNPTSFPAAYPGVVAVAAIDQSDHRAPFSQTGPHIDLAAPGVAVLSTVWNDGFATMSGTSMATPHVSGVAALVLSCNASLTGAQVADILRQTARPLRDNPADPVPNGNYGFGCVDAQAAVNRACPAKSVPIVACPAPSLIVAQCNSRPIVSCVPPSTLLWWCRSVPIVTCRPSLLVRCITVPISCPRPSNPLITCPQPSIVTVCPSGPICGIGGPIDPGPLGPGSEAGWGQPGDPYGVGATALTPYDPYGEGYGGEGGCGS